MESLKLSFEAVMPIFLLMLLGYFLKSIKITEKKTFDAVNKLVFKVFLPTLLFYNIYKTESIEVFNPEIVIFTITAVLCIFVLGYFAVFGLTRSNTKRGVMLQGIYRSNFAILGIPIMTYICRGNISGLASLMVAIVIPLFNVLAVFALERFRSGKLDIIKLLKGILTNPLIIGCVIGAIFMALRIKLPNVLETAVSDVAGLATPLAIIVLGASFSFSSIKGYVKDILVVVSAKLVIVPLIVVWVAIMLGFRGEELACLLVIFGSPVAVSSFAMAQQMGGDERLAAHCVVITSIACIFTLFVWIFVLSFLGLF